jgi:DnaJ family protein A protein 5
MILFMHPSCFSGYHDAKGGFYYVYKNVFRDIASCERNQGDMLVELPTKFGNADSDWLDVLNFYQHWESFVSALNFAWEDIYNVFEDAANRKIKRLMEEENKKARKNAKKTYNQDVLALVAFVKRRDPRVKAKQQELEKQKMEKQQKVKMEAEERKKEQQLAKEAWKEEAARAMMQAEEEDRLHGRVRLADLEDDYDYGGGKKKKGRGKKKKNKQRHEEEQYQEEMKVLEKISLLMGDEEDKEKSCETLDDEEGEADAAGEDQTEPSAMRDETGDDLEVEEPPVPIEAEEEYFSESISEEEPDIWQCECCRKIFKSEGQMENHMKSKKHKLAFKKYQEKLMRQEEEEVMEEMMHSLVMEP